MVKLSTNQVTDSCMLAEFSDQTAVLGGVRVQRT